MKLHLPKLLLTAVLSACVVGTAAWAETLTISTATDWGTDRAYEGNTNEVIINNNASLTLTSGASANTHYNYGASITVEQGSTLNVNMWGEGASDKRDYDDNGRPIIDSKIILNNSTLRVLDGSYSFGGGITVSGAAQLDNDWSKGHTIKKLSSNGAAILTLNKKANGWGDNTPWILLNEGAYSGRVEMTNTDGDEETAIQRLVFSHGSALSNGADKYTTVVNTGSGAYDYRNYITLNTAESYLKGIGGKGTIELCSGNGSAGLSAAKLIVSNDGTVTDVFTGTVGNGVTLEIAGGSQIFGQITNKGNITLSGEGRFVVQNISEHAGFVANSDLVNHDGTTGGVNGFVNGGTISLYTEDSTGTGPETVYYNGTSYRVTDGAIQIGSILDTYYIGGAATQSDLDAAKTAATNGGATLGKLVIQENGVLSDLTHNDGTGFFSGAVEVTGGGHLKLSNDALGWGTGTPSALILAGKAAEGETPAKLAQMTLDGTVTFECAVDMKGNAVINDSGDYFIDTLGTTVNVSGQNNTISTDIRDRGGLVIDTEAGGSLIISGKILAHPGSTFSGNASTTKKGEGDVTFSAAGSTFSGKVTIEKGKLTLSGDKTTLKNGVEVLGGSDKRLSTAAGDGKTITIEGASTIGGYLTADSGTVLFTGNVTANGEKSTLELARTSTEGTEIILAGETNDVRLIDLSNGNNAHGKLILRNGQTTADTLWVTKNSSIVIEDGASFVTFSNGVNANNGMITVTGQGKNSSITYTNDSDTQYYSSNAAYTISSADVTINSASEVTLANKLDTVSVTNDNTGLLKITHADNSLTELHALKGSINVTGQDKIVLNALTIAKDNTLTVDTVAVGGGSPVATLCTESPSSTATLEGGAKVVGNLDLSNANVLTLKGIGEGSLVTVTGNFVLPEGTLTLGGNILDTLATLESGSQLDVFSVGSFTLGGQAITSLTYESGYTLDQVFVGASSDYYLGYTANADGTGGIVYIGVIPEPTTATLSLMALAALAARRRRASR